MRERLIVYCRWLTVLIGGAFFLYGVLPGNMFAAADGQGQKTHKEMKHTAPAITVIGAWARASAPMAKNGVAYLTIANHGWKDDTLIAVRTKVSKKAELHTHLNEGGVMKMRRIPSITVPAQGKAALKPGGDHIMFMGLKKPLKTGDHLMLSLIFASGAEKVLKVMVMKGGAKMKMKHTH